MDDIRIQFNWQKLIYQIFSKKIEIDENWIEELKAFHSFHEAKDAW